MRLTTVTTAALALCAALMFEARPSLATEDGGFRAAPTYAGSKPLRSDSLARLIQTCCLPHSRPILLARRPVVRQRRWAPSVWHRESC